MITSATIQERTLGWFRIVGPSSITPQHEPGQRRRSNNPRHGGEYACRAGTRSARPDGFGDEFLGRYAWYQANSNRQSHPVGLLKPNDLGLFDIFGNAVEWCLDRYGLQPTGDPVTTPKDAMRVIRGGSYSYAASDLGSTKRLGVHADSPLPGYSFRVIRTLR